MPDALRTAIVGAAGYTGAELVRLVCSHPRLQLAWVGARDRAGMKLGDALPSTAGVQGVGDLVLEAFDPAKADELAKKVDVAFSALPHGASAEACAALFDAGVLVVDLSADYRLRDREIYEATYANTKHPRPDLLSRAVYGLPEWHRADLAGARLIAAPGCYPTGAVLALAPLLAGGLIESDGIIIDSKSGVSGSGRTPLATTHLPETSEGMRAYKVAGAHRHTPEIEQELSRAAGAKASDIRVTFTPHLAPMTRGILTTAYARAAKGVTADACRRAATERYAGSLVTVLDAGAGKLPDTLWVRGSARAHVAYAKDERTGVILAMSALDNLTRGAAAQAIQALNVSMGWPDALGLPEIGTFP